MMQCCGLTRFVFVLREAIRDDFEQAVMAFESFGLLYCPAVSRRFADGTAASRAHGRQPGTGHAFWTARAEGHAR